MTSVFSIIVLYSSLSGKMFYLKFKKTSFPPCHVHGLHFVTTTSPPETGDLCACQTCKLIKTLLKRECRKKASKLQGSSFVYVKVSHSRQILKDLINEFVSGTLSQCEPTTFVPEFIEDVSFFILS